MTRDRRIALGLAIFVIATRLPFVTHVLWEWDSVLYARALEDGFHVTADFTDQRPHPPGYIFYVAIATVARWILRDSNAALVAISVLASGAAAAAVYLLARRFARGELAAFAAFDPLVWAHSEIALPYIVLALGSATFALLFWEARHASEPRAILTSLAFGIGVGFRQDLLLILGPLWLWSVASGGPRRVALCAVAVGVASLTWLVPSAVLSGGLDAYLRAIATQSGTITGHSVVSGAADVLWYDVRLTVLALAWGLFAVGVVLLGLLLAPALHWARRPRLRRPGEPTTFFLLWLLPGLVVYLLWIIGDWGYVLSLLPGLYVLCAALLARALLRAHGPAVLVTRGALVAVLLGTVLFFVFADARWSRAVAEAHDRSVNARVAYVRGHFDPKDTVLLAREDYQLARYYLNEYRAWLYDPAPAGSTDRPKSPPATLVLFTPDLVLRQPIGVIPSPEARAVGLTVLAPSSIKLSGVDPIAREP